MTIFFSLTCLVAAHFCARELIGLVNEVRAIRREVEAADEVVRDAIAARK